MLLDDRMTRKLQYCIESGFFSMAKWSRMRRHDYYLAWSIGLACLVVAPAAHSEDVRLRAGDLLHADPFSFMLEDSSAFRDDRLFMASPTDPELNMAFPPGDWFERSSLAEPLRVGSIDTHSFQEDAIGIWSEISPPTRKRHRAIYDPVRDRMIVFGGKNGAAGSNRTWVLCFGTDATWKELETEGVRPPPLEGGSAIYDSRLDRMIVFGGWDGLKLRNETWELTLSQPPTWRLLSPEGTLPEARAAHAAVFDSRQNRMLIFGGSSTTQQSLGDTWQLALDDQPTWKRLRPEGVGPRERWGHTAVYDSLGNRMLIFGGVFSFSDFIFETQNDVWALELDEQPMWNEIVPLGVLPTARLRHSATFDPKMNRMYVFGGTTTDRFNPRLDDLFELSLAGVPTWRRIERSGVGPVARSSHSGVYDSRRRRLVVFGGARLLTLHDTWAISLDDLAGWEKGTAADDLPSQRLASTLTYDPMGERMILLGGLVIGGFISNETWQLNLGEVPEWKQLTPAGEMPIPRAGHTAIYDPVRKRIVVFGGTDNIIPFNDVWILDLAGETSWKRVEPIGEAPVPRVRATSIYDPLGDRMIVFGGGTSQGSRNDIWALSLGGEPEWNQIVPTAPLPTAAGGASAIYDPLRHRMLVFGGSIGERAPSTQTWELSLDDTPTWRMLSPSTQIPSGRSSHSAIYDPIRDRMVIVGNVLEDSHAWGLSLDGEPTWSKLAPGAFGFDFRSLHASAYDPVRDRMILFGGRLVIPFNDLWALSWGEEIRDVSIDVRPGSKENPINVTARGVVPAAILSRIPSFSCDTGFDPTTVDLSSLRLGGAGVRARGQGRPQSTYSDLNHDGLRDLLVFFDSEDLELEDGNTMLVLEGRTHDGTRFRGKDIVRFVGTGGKSSRRTAGILSAGHVSINSSGPALSIETAKLSPGVLEISLFLPEPGPVKIELFDVRGRRLVVRRLDGFDQGLNRAQVKMPRSLRHGIYLLRVTQKGISVSRKVSLLG